MRGEINKELEEKLKLAELILDRHLTNKEHIVGVFGEDEFNNRLYFNRGKVEILKDKLRPIEKPKPIGEYLNPPIVNKELEKCLDELFPKIERTQEVIFLEEIKSSILYYTGDYYNQVNNADEGVLNIIKKIQKESGRDRALVLFALAQKIIDETERRVIIKLTKQYGSKIWD